MYITNHLGTKFSGYLTHKYILMAMFHFHSHFLQFVLLDIKFGQFYLCLTYDSGDLSDINIFSCKKNVCVKQKKKKITQFGLSNCFNDCSLLTPQKLRKQRYHLRNRSVFSVIAGKKNTTD